MNAIPPKYFRFPPGYTEQAQTYMIDCVSLVGSEARRKMSHEFEKTHSFHFSIMCPKVFFEKKGQVWIVRCVEMRLGKILSLFHYFYWWKKAVNPSWPCVARLWRDLRFVLSWRTHQSARDSKQGVLKKSTLNINVYTSPPPRNYVQCVSHCSCQS